MSLRFHRIIYIRSILTVLRQLSRLVRKLMIVWSRLNQPLLWFLNLVMVIVILILCVVVLKTVLVAMLLQFMIMFGD
nr:MAG TPA: hypothetical protein [Bacteriophage sp.]